MKTKKILASFLSVSVLAAYPLFGAAASPIRELKPITDEVNPISTPLEQASYFAFSGTVKEIEGTQPGGLRDCKYVFVENAEGQEAYFVISSNTFIINEEELKVGSEVTGFYDANKPMLMIYPPQYPVDVVAVNVEKNVKFDIFDEELISSDRSLKLNISSETEIVTQDGTAYKGDLALQKLVVLFGASTKSIPAQTNPTKIIVLQEACSGNGKDAPLPVEKIEPRNFEIVVSNKKIQAPNTYLDISGTLMVPLRAVAESLGLKITWNNDLHQVTVGENIILTIGQSKYISPNSTANSLEKAPELKDGTTFVPVSLFSETITECNVSILEDKIIINH